MNEDLSADQIDRSEGLEGDQRGVVRRENQIAGRYWGGVEWRIVGTFGLGASAWIGVIVAVTSGAIPMWAGTLLNIPIASTFYMPLHESVHGNISGRVASMRWLNELVGRLAGVPILMAHGQHRASHMRHHAFTNEPGRDPDYFSRGQLHELLGKWYGMTLLNTFLPLFAAVRPARRLLPVSLRRGMAGGGRAPRDAAALMRVWVVTHAALALLALAGAGGPAFFLWYVPARVQMLWLMTVFAWYPHHPADAVGRYVDTRVATFPLSRVLLRGHDHHAVHHLFPRVPHYRLAAVWSELAADLVPRGVRAQGGAVGSTGPVEWR